MNFKKTLILIFISGILIANIFAWQKVFALCDDNLKVYFLDVGQGDSEFIQTPDNRQIIIDGGPGSAVLEKIFKLMGFFDRKIDIVILSHPDLDHMQGLIEILKKYKANYIIQAGAEKESEDFLAWQKVLSRQKSLGAKIINVKAGDVIKVGHINLEILFPLENLSGQKIKKYSNEACVVVKLYYGRKCFLFTGDIGEKTEREIIKSNQNIDCDILKVAHHGSKYSTSEEFLQSLSPEIAIIEVGKNSYGHPTQEVLQRLEKFDIKVLRTDISGDIKIVSDGNNLKLKTQK